MKVSMLETEENKMVFQKIYEENRKLLYYAAWKICQNEADAEAAVLACFVKLAAKFKKYSQLSEEELVRLCVVVVTSKAGDLVKKRDSRGSCFEKEALAREDRNLLYLYYVIGLNKKEISELLAKPIDIVEKSMNRGRTKLVGELGLKEQKQ